MNHNPNSKNPKEIDGTVEDWHMLRATMVVVREITNDPESGRPDNVVKTEPQDYISQP